MLLAEASGLRFRGEQKGRFHRSMISQFGQTDFFNSIGRFLPVAATGDNGQFFANHGYEACWSNPMQSVGKRVVM